MKAALFLAILSLSLSPRLFTHVPPGTVLPVTLDSSLSVKSRPGQVITARIMQDVPLGPGVKIRAGSKLLGHVIEVVHPAPGSGAAITFSFDSLKISHRTIPVVTDLRAMASFVEIDDAQIPDTGPDRGTAPAVYTTNQVGGEVVYRGGGPVADGDEVVGTPVPGGVLGKLRPNPSGQCRGPIAANDQPQALWLFSTNACGEYGYPEITIAHAGRSEPFGRITLSSKDAGFNVRGGSGMLLRIISSI
ncbi:MAG TPA: hypothetical protein VMJ93_10530 [Verrucomicrobiae bacterium]|nr:hypothetical protein [Verrucomicrobiae bacterium]